MASVAAPPAPAKGPQINGHSLPSKGRMSGAGTSTPQPTSSANAIPLSVRKSAGLDLSTVERRGQPNAVKEVPVKNSRPHGLEEAPTFYPTEEEFKSGPLNYIRKIAEEGSKYGIVKVVPPEGWNPPFAIDTERFHFRTRKQELNLADGGTRANLNYLDQLAMFHKQRSGTHLNRFPSVDKRPLDLYKLKKLVEDKGGFDRVCKDKRWAEIGRDLGYSGKIMSSLSTSLKNSYQKWLQPYEDWLKQNRPAVLLQQERENGGPYTPSPGATPAKSANNSPMPMANTSPAMRATQNLAAALQEPPKPAEPPQSGFTAVNTGFTAVNAPSGFAAINIPAPTPSESFPASEQSVTSEGPVGVKRQHSEESTNGDDSGRRSKRVKQESAPTVTGSQMIQPRISAPKQMTTRDKSNDKPGDCEACGRGEDAGLTIICDSCDVTYHRACLDTPVRGGSESDWHCQRCLVGTGEFGFEDGGIYSLKKFQEKAHRFKELHFARKLVFDPVTGRRTVSEEDVEREFWRLTESLTDTVEVEYGADIHSTTHGSGFDTIERQPFSPYSIDPWNLNVMPLDKDSLFRYIKTDISGMTVPWLYVGMCFSTFCWHNEDHYTYSANYQHFGETKTWYGIPSGYSEKFETAMKEAVPELFEQQPDLLFQLVTLLQPEKLKKAGVQVYALDQRAGEFVITFPQAYHAGFNHGFNFNEAVNFAPPDWEPFGGLAIQRLQDFRRQPVFSHEELLFSAAARDHTIKTAKWLGPALKRVMTSEFKARDAFKAEYRNAVLSTNIKEENGHDISPPFTLDSKDVPDEETVCMFCKAYGHLSRFVCKNSSKVICLLHAAQIECCSTHVDQRLNMRDGQHELRYRVTDDDIESLVEKVVDLARTPEAWQEKLDTLLEDGPKPSLKSLRAVLAEGEKIDSSWPLTQLADLKAFVARCNAWVEEATAYIARKPNRRKSEFRSRGSINEERKKTERDDSKKDALRNPENIRKLLKSAKDLSFECPELEKLHERAERIADFRNRAKSALKLPHIAEDALDELIEEGKDLDIDVPEMKSLDVQSRTVRWFAKAKEFSEQLEQGSPMTLNDVNEFIAVAKDLNIADDNEYMKYFARQKDQGEFWESKAHQVMSVENVNYQQLEALFTQASKLPVSRETLAAIDEMLKKQREAQEKIVTLYERTKELDMQNRPTYKEVRETMEALADLNSKPAGTLDLEKEQKRHEDWMRRGKKLFGKANAPLRILLEYMQFVQERNDHCFSLKDQPRMPVEPASREASPDEEQGGEGSSSSENVFCICRKPESGMMIECELCHEWYHGRCLKIARGKVKEDDKYTCPICDYRVKIPRDANRPKLEELQGWQDEIPNLPFQPEEEECLDHIIRTAQDFRNSIAHLIKPIMSTPDDLPVQRFYLRKIEGAEVLLVEETNFLRQQVHRWAPVAPEPPRMIEVSLSTRKPRPTKVQKLMAQLGITNEDDLPEHLRPKVSRKRPTNDYISGKGSKPANPSSAAKPGESVQSHDHQGTAHETPTPSSSRDIRSPLDISGQPHHSSHHSGSFGYNGLTMTESHSPVAMHGPSPYAAPTSPLFPSASNVADYPRGGPGHGGDQVDPELETMFASASGTSPLPQHSQQQMSSHAHSHSGGSQPGEDLFKSLTNGVEGDEGEAMDTMEDGTGTFEFPEATGGVYSSLGSIGDGETY